MNSNRNVLVTGGAGYVGSHACKALAEAGFEPVTFDNLGRGHRHAVKFGPFVQGDIRDAAALSNAIGTHRISAIMHFAAFAYVGESMRAPEAYFENNVVGSLTLLDVARSKGIKHVVFSSTCAVYGNVDDRDIDESLDPKPINPYGESKLFVERALHWHEQAHGMRHVALRYFNAAGADPAGEIGEEHEDETHLIPLAIGAALGHRPPLRIFGGDFPTPDGTPVRDYVHVSDLADAHVAALRFMREQDRSARINLGTGQGLSVRDVLNGIARLVGHEVPCVVTDRRAGDPARLVARVGRADELLGWRARRSDPQTMLSTALAWFRAHPTPPQPRVSAGTAT